MLNIIILAAGIGSRLGRTIPKSLTILDDGKTIMQRQIDNLYSAFGQDIKIHIVVGYKAELIAENRPESTLIYNEDYDITNTSKSLLKGIQALPKDTGVLWLNGDVVFDYNILLKSLLSIKNEQSFVLVNTSIVEDEEIKYTVSNEGFIKEISKTIPCEEALGEAVGINYISKKDIKIFTYWLKKVNSNDYFEKALEEAICNENILVEPLDISKHGFSVEVDFIEDLHKANLAIN